jgi:hypothetical protein
LGDVEETVYVVEEDEEEEEVLRVGSIDLFAVRRLLTFFAQTVHKKSEMLFVRGKSHSPCFLRCVEEMFTLY